ncbi:hypothetical protein [Streptomyces sp. NPDC049744]|uniref:hypothetical protein n=1 Tax=Streptomyces sp. NPDC049744 TaxID=3154359 RepID=UPI0034207AAD
MFHEPWQRWAWAAVPLVSLATLAFLPFVVAWRKGVVSAVTVGWYALGSAVVIGFATVKPEVNALFPTLVWAFIITAIIHILWLDSRKRSSK